MLLSEPQESPYDWRFQILGFPVRVTWMFWLFSAAFGYTQARYLHNVFVLQNIPSHFAVLLLIWVLTTFLSILIHEMGHGFAFRYFGIDASIVLYQMGGLAIPGAGLLWSRQGQRTRIMPRDQLVISAAGPAIQIAAGLLVGAAALAMGLSVPLFGWAASYMGVELPARALGPNAYVYTFVNFFVNSSIFWALFNLLPVYPMDGGQITRQVLTMILRRDALYEASFIGMIVGGIVALWWYQTGGGPMGVLLFGSLAYTNFQIVQSHNHRSPW